MGISDALLDPESSDVDEVDDLNALSEFTQGLQQVLETQAAQFYPQLSGVVIADRMALFTTLGHYVRDNDAFVEAMKGFGISMLTHGFNTKGYTLRHAVSLLNIS